MTSECLLKMALYNVEHGFRNLEYRTFPCQLVEAGRDAICSHALQESYDFILSFDGDSVFPPDALARLLYDAYVRQPGADVIGAYAQLKGSYLPTTDTGSGCWEPHFPGEGLIPVIRTGGHFLLVKTQILKRFGPPWFRTRQAIRPLDVLAELDNYARCNLDGRNPFAELAEWSALAEKARASSQAGTSGVGEDSGFCDQAKAAGGSIFVDTDLVSGHVAKHVISPEDLRKRLREREERTDLAVGVLS